MDAITKMAPEYLNDTLAGFKTFKVESKRADKKFPLGSMEISREVGAALLRANPHISVDVHNPEITVRVEIREKAAYIHGETKPGAGGMSDMCGRQKKKGKALCESLPLSMFFR